jgi:two-component system, LuxR family, sensor kinase FixL
MTSRPGPAFRSRRLPPDRSALIGLARALAAVIAYGLCFVGLHRLAANWATVGSYSLWFPGAGLRFAFLWRAGPRYAPAAALCELVLQLVTGELVMGPAPWFSLIGIVGPTLAYGAVIHLVRERAGRRTPMLALSPLPFALAALIAPIVACLSSLPWTMGQEGALGDLRHLVGELVTFTLGDMLGVLMVAPPLIWLFDRLTGAQPWIAGAPRPLAVTEAVFLTAFAWGVVAAIDWAGLGIRLQPVLMVAVWIGLRTGRVGAWASALLAAAVVLPLSRSLPGMDAGRRLGLHMHLACIASVAYLAASFAEAEGRSRGEIARRDRILFQAERLKTLRAMSVAVIHELSQPLSTIAIEARHLADASRDPKPDMGEIGGTAELIARKAGDLATLVRRLRRFGDRGQDTPSEIPVGPLLADVVTIAGPEAKAAKSRLALAPVPHLVVFGRDIEIRQALLNLVRNAIAASPGGEVLVTAFALGDRVHVVVENDEPGVRERGSGMGLGLIIARSIAEAHGGRIVEDRPAPRRVRFTLDLPVAAPLE